MNKLKTYTKSFFKDESGMEILQAAGIIVLSVGMLALVFKLGDTIKKYISDANDEADRQFKDTLTGNGSGVTGGTP